MWKKQFLTANTFVIYLRVTRVRPWNTEWEVEAAVEALHVFEADGP